MSNKGIIKYLFKIQASWTRKCHFRAVALRLLVTIIPVWDFPNWIIEWMNEIIFITSLDQGPWGLNFTMTFKFCVCFLFVCELFFYFFPKSPPLWYLISDYFETFFFVSSHSSPLSSDILLLIMIITVLCKILLLWVI